MKWHATTKSFPNPGEKVLAWVGRDKHYEIGEIVMLGGEPYWKLDSLGFPIPADPSVGCKIDCWTSIEQPTPSNIY